jgi:hypothetical protein
VGALFFVGAALCRERAAQQPQDFKYASRLPGLFHSPFAAQGRSYR